MAPHASGYWQMPQFRFPPQPSPAAPQLKPRSLHVFGLHGGPMAHLLYACPPQTSGAGHVPQVMAPPQPSPFVPHSKPWSPHVRGMHFARMGTSGGASAASPASASPPVSAGASTV